MKGSQSLIIDIQEILKGMSSSDDISDGGFSPLTEGLNLVGNPGAIYAPAALVDADSDVILTGGIIASVPDHNLADVDARLLVADNGTFYKYNGTKLQYPDEAAAEDSANTFAKGFTDAINFDGSSFFTSKEKITKWSGASTFDHDYTTSAFANTTYPHPAIVFENNAFYGDGKLLLRQTSATAAPATILTLSGDEVIIALGLDPSTSKMLISTTQTLDVSQTLSMRFRVYWYDGVSNKADKVIDVEDAINAFINFGGRIYVGYGTNIGYLMGSGIEFVRSLLEVYKDSNYLPTKHSFAIVGKMLCVTDGVKVLALTKIAGRDVWHYCGKNKLASPDNGKLRAIFPMGLGKLGMSMDTTKCYTLAVSAISASVAETAPTTLNKFYFMTNWYNFARPIKPQSVELEYISQVASSGNISLSYFDQNAATSAGSLARKNGTRTNTFVIDEMVGFLTTQKVTALKFLLENATTNDGLKRIILYYDWFE